MSGRFACFLVPFALLPSATWAQNRTVSTTILLTTGTSIPLPPTSQLSNQTAPAVCVPTAPTCPACDGQIIQDGSGSNYEVYCNAYISSSAVSQQPTLITPIECLMACDGFFGCTGAYINGDGSCTLSIGSVFGTLQLDGYIGFIPMEDTPEITSSSTYDANSTVLATSTKSSMQPLATSYGNVTSTAFAGTAPMNTAPMNTAPLYTAPANTVPAGSASGLPGLGSYPFPNATLPSNSTTNTTGTAGLLRPTGTSGRCSLDNLSCPACKNQIITDNFDVSYNVICDSVLESDSQYAFAEPLPAAYCLAQCDERNSTCLGAYWQDEECTLALGKLNGPLDNPGYIAFVPVKRVAGAARPTGYSTGTVPIPISTGLSWLNMSAYPTGSVTSTGRSVPLGTGSIATTTSTPMSIVTTTSLIYAPAPTCNPQAISCPECDGLRLVNSHNATYRLQCNFAPTCDETQGFYGQVSINLCMERCDKDASCLAAIFNEGHCDFCQGSMEGTYEEDVDYLVLVPEIPAPNATAPATSSKAITTSISSSSPTPTPTPTCDATSPLCPECAYSGILSPSGAAFSTHCYDAPACDSSITVNDLPSWAACLDACAEDPICRSAVFANGICDLCQVTSNSTLHLIAAGRPSTPHWIPMALVAERPVANSSSVQSASTVDTVSVTSTSYFVPEPSGPPMFFSGAPAEPTSVAIPSPGSVEPTNNGPTPTAVATSTSAPEYGGRGGRHHGDGNGGHRGWHDEHGRPGPGFGGRGGRFSWGREGKNAS